MADTAEWVRRVLAGDDFPEAAEKRRASLPRPETDTQRFVREALGEPPLAVPPSVMNRALIVLLEAEQDRRRLLKQQGNNR